MTVDPQPIPDAARCPECGGLPAEASHNLSDLGYTHDDRQAICTECGGQWTMGIPVGRADEYFWNDLSCPACSGEAVAGRVNKLKHYWHKLRGIDCDCTHQWLRVHRIHPNKDKDVVGLHMKCPRCYHVVFIQRVLGETDTAIVGWPMTTGELGDGHGWTNDENGIRPNESHPEYGGSVEEVATATIDKSEVIE